MQNYCCSRIIDNFLKRLFSELRAVFHIWHFYDHTQGKSSPLSYLWLYSVPKSPATGQTNRLSPVRPLFFSTIRTSTGASSASAGTERMEQVTVSLEKDSLGLVGKAAANQSFLNHLKTTLWCNDPGLISVIFVILTLLFWGLASALLW